MEQRTTVGNKLLAALPSADLDLLNHFRKVALERDTVLARSGRSGFSRIVPSSGLVAFIMDMPSGETVATAVVGNDGCRGPAVGAGTHALAGDHGGANCRDCLANLAARFQAALRRSNPIRVVVQTLTRSLLAQFQHTAACNALHTVEARLARWLLQVHDRAEGDVLPLTQETLSEMLGVRRPT